MHRLLDPERLIFAEIQLKCTPLGLIGSADLRAMRTVRTARLAINILRTFILEPSHVQKQTVIVGARGKDLLERTRHYDLQILCVSSLSERERKKYA